MKNKLIDLNNHLFEQMERLNDETLTEKELKNEITRSKQVVAVSRAITANANTMLVATRLTLEYGKDSANKMPSILQIEGSGRDDKEK
ncbi:MAG: hypothetical protein ABII85_01720 [Bacillota bacterium]